MKIFAVSLLVRVSPKCIGGDCQVTNRLLSTPLNLRVALCPEKGGYSDGLKLFLL